MRVGLVVFDDVDYGLDVASALHGSGLSVVLYLSYAHAARYMGTAERPAERIHEVGLLPRECQVRLFRMPRIRDPRSLVMIDRLARAMSHDRVDVAHLLVGPGEFWVAALSVRLRRTPVAATMIIPKPNVGDALPASIVIGVYKLLARGADVVIVNGADQIGFVQERYGTPSDRIAYVSLGPRTTALKWASTSHAEEPGTVLFFGAARSHKGLQVLVQAQPSITTRLPRARILLASRGEEVRRCMELARERSKYEVFDGFVPSDMAAAFFQRASVVVLPYLSASTSGVLMTAYAFGKPVVASRVGCLPEYIEEGVTGLMVPPGDPERLADAIVELLTDDARRREMGRSARLWAEEKRKSAARETVQAYEKAIAFHSGNRLFGPIHENEKQKGLTTMPKPPSLFFKPVVSGGSPPRLTLIGCGAIAENYYLPSLSGQPRILDALTLVDTDIDRARKLAADFGGRRYVADFRDALDDSDGVIIALPTHLHHPVAMECLSRGLPVLCEKPLAESANKAEEMIKQARKAGVALATNYQQRLWPQFLKAKELIDEGSLGEPLSIMYRVGEMFAWPTVSGFYFNSAGAGRGVLRDRGAHVLDHICWWLGGAPIVTNSRNDSFGGSEALAEVRFERGRCAGEVKLSWLSSFPCHFTIEFERGSIEGEVYYPQDVVVRAASGPRKRMRLKWEGYAALGRRIVTNFIEILGVGGTPIVSGGDVLDSLRTVDECYRLATRFDMAWYELSGGDYE